MNKENDCMHATIILGKASSKVKIQTKAYKYYKYIEINEHIYILKKKPNISRSNWMNKEIDGHKNKHTQTHTRWYCERMKLRGKSCLELEKNASQSSQSRKSQSDGRFSVILF